MAQLQVKITPVNDRPRLTKRWCPFPPVPENTTKVKCIRVGDLMNMSSAYIDHILKRKVVPKDITDVKSLVADRRPYPIVADPDNSEFGLVVLDQKTKAKYGKWMFKIKGRGVLQEINMTAGMKLLLGPDDCIFFRAKTNTASWLKDEAFQSIFLMVKAYDNSDQRSSGYYAMNSSSMDSDSSLSRENVKFVAAQVGCDNVAWSNKKRDRCKQCPGRGIRKDSCVGCDGVPNSNKTRGKRSLRPTRTRVGKV